MDWTTTTTTTTMDNNVVVPPRFSRLPLLPMVSSISIGRSFSHDVTSTGQQETRKTPLLLNKGSRLFHLPAPSTCCFFWRLFDDKLKCLFFCFSPLWVFPGENAPGDPMTTTDGRETNGKKKKKQLINKVPEYLNAAVVARCARGLSVALELN